MIGIHLDFVFGHVVSSRNLPYYVRFSSKKPYIHKFSTSTTEQLTSLGAPDLLGPHINYGGTRVNTLQSKFSNGSKFPQRFFLAISQQPFQLHALSCKFLLHRRKKTPRTYGSNLRACPALVEATIFRELYNVVF